MKKRMTIVDLLNSIANNTQPKEIVIEDVSKNCIFDKFYWTEGCKQYINIQCNPAGIKLGEETMNLVVEYEVSILTDKEKEYLSNIIKPFRDKIVTILKLPTGPNKEYIEMIFKDYDSSMSFIDFPPFDENTMYINMEKFHRYSLEELEL